MAGDDLQRKVWESRGKEEEEERRNAYAPL